MNGVVAGRILCRQAQWAHGIQPLPLCPERLAASGDDLFAIGLPIAFGVVMIELAQSTSSALNQSATPLCVGVIRPVFIWVTGGLEAIAGLLLLIPDTSRAGAIGSVVILTAAVITLIRHHDWGHLPGAVVLTAVAVAVAIRG